MPCYAQHLVCVRARHSVLCAQHAQAAAAHSDRAIEAAEAAISNPLLDDSSMQGARGVLINITAGKDLTLFEVDEAANRIRKEVDEEANIIFGSTFDEALEGRIRVSVVATGIDANASQMALPTMLHLADQLEKFELQPEVDSPPAPKMDSSIEAVMETGADPDPEPGPNPGPDPKAEPEHEPEVDS